MRTGHTQDCMPNWNTRGVLCLLDRLLDGSDRFVEINDDALTRAARIGQPVTAVAQTVLRNLGNQNACLGAAHVNGGQEIFLRFRPGYWVPCPFMTAGLGFCGVTGDLEVLGLTACGAGFAARLVGAHRLRQRVFWTGLLAAGLAAAAGGTLTGSRFTSAAGLTPADIAARTTAGESAG